MTGKRRFPLKVLFDKDSYTSIHKAYNGHCNHVHRISRGDNMSDMAGKKTSRRHINDTTDVVCAAR